MRMRTLLILGLTLSTAATAVAQAGPRRMARPGGAPGAEQLLRMAEQLELTQDQLTRLRAIREEALNARIAATTDMMRLQSQRDAGEITREQFTERVRAQRETVRPRMQAASPERLREILTEAQRDKLREVRSGAMREQMRMGMRMRRDAMRGWREMEVRRQMLRFRRGPA